MQLDLCILHPFRTSFSGSDTPFEMSCPSDLIHITFTSLKWASLTHNHASPALVYFSFFFIELTEKTTSIASSQNPQLCVFSLKKTFRNLQPTCRNLKLCFSKPATRFWLSWSTPSFITNLKTTCYHQIITFLELNTCWYTICSSFAFFFAYRTSINLIQQWVTQPSNSFLFS